MKARDTIEATELFMQSHFALKEDDAQNTTEYSEIDSDDEYDVGSRALLKCKLNGHHPTVRIYGGGGMSINVCVPLMGSKDYTFRALMEDVCEFWNLPTTMLVPRFQLIANVDPFVNNMIYDFKPHAFDPEESVIEALTSLKHDWNRGFGSQTGMPPAQGTLPWLHCQPNVSGDELSTLVLAPELQPHFFMRA